MDRLGGAFDSFDGHDNFDDFVDNDDTHSNPPPSPVGQDERRMQVRAYNHWASLLGDNRLPLIEDLEPEFLGDFGPHSVLLDFSTGSGSPTIQFIGDKLSAECGLYEDIEELNEIPSGSLLSQIAGNYLKILSEQAPTGFEAEFVNAKGATVLYRGILLPYSSDCETLDFVYAVINWKEMADAETANRLLQQIDEALETDGVDTAEDADPAPLPVRSPLQLSDPDESPSAAFTNVDPPAEENRSAGSAVPVERDGEPAHAASEAATPRGAPKSRAVDALGNPIGAVHEELDGETEAEPDHGHSGPLTAADYGLPDWDDEEYVEDDVDELVNPLANIDLNSPLLSLVNPQTRAKKAVDLHGTVGNEDHGDAFDEAEQEARLDTSYLATEIVPDEPEIEVMDDRDGVHAEAEADALSEIEPYEDCAQVAEELDEPSEMQALEPVAIEAIEEPAGAHALGERDDDFVPAISTHEGTDDVELTSSAHVSDLGSVEQPAEESFAGESQEEPLELTAEMVAVEDSEAELDEPEIGSNVDFDGESCESFEEGNAGPVFEHPVPQAVEAPIEEKVQEPCPAEAVVADAPDLDAKDEEYHVAANADSEALGQSISAEELESSLAVASELARPEAATDSDTRKALFEAVRLAYDLAANLRDEGDPAVTPEASDSIDALAEQLRELEAGDLRDLSVRGPEFALVMVRRGENGELTVLGEVPEEAALVGNAARKLLGR